MSKLKIKEVYRYARPYKNEPEIVDGYPNHFAITNKEGSNLVLLERGINTIGIVNAPDGTRTPAILIRSSPHKIGSETTPWQDVFDVDNGHIRYYGDNRTPGTDPALSPGNRTLLQCFDTYNNSDKRGFSVPLIFYKAVSKDNKQKGFIEFNGFGIITGVELLTQYDRKLDRTFSNYAFNFHVFALTKDNEEFNWKWINSRRSPDVTLFETLKLAPHSWREWIKYGNKVLERCRRRVSKLSVKSRDEQIPGKGSAEEKVLKEIYKFYHLKKATFEGLAADVTARIFKYNNGTYHSGWITPSTSDGGADFYGRLDLGSGFGKAKLIVLGQAKCESINTPTGGNHVARTVARLKRGWIGVYITTSFFSEAVQREIIEDEYPIMLVNGNKLAETVLKILYEEGFSTLEKYLEDLELKYAGLIQHRRAEEILFE